MRNGEGGIKDKKQKGLKSEVGMRKDTVEDRNRIDKKWCIRYKDKSNKI